MNIHMYPYYFLNSLLSTFITIFRSWTVMFNPCALDTRGREGGASGDKLLRLTLVHWIGGEGRGAR